MRCLVTIFESQMSEQEIIDQVTSMKGVGFAALGGREETKLEKAHWHLYLEMKTGSKIKSIAKMFHNSHVDKCRGSYESNLNYISKTGEIIFQYGEPSEEDAPQRRNGERWTKEDEEALVNDIMNGVEDFQYLLEKYGMLVICHANNIKTLLSLIKGQKIAKEIKEKQDLINATFKLQESDELPY